MIYIIIILTALLALMSLTALRYYNLYRKEQEKLLDARLKNFLDQL